MKNVTPRRSRSVRPVDARKDKDDDDEGRVGNVMVDDMQITMRDEGGFAQDMG